MQRFPFAKLFLLILGIFLLVLVILSVFLFTSTAHIMREQMGSKCVGVASAVAVLIEQDAAAYREFQKTLDPHSDYYRHMRSNLMKIRSNSTLNIAYLYTEVRVSETEMMYLLDAESVDSPFFSSPGSVDRLTDSEYLAYEARAPFVPQKFVTNDYGTLLTCYAPIIDPEDGAFLGLVGVDVSIEQYHDVIFNQLAASIGSLAAMLALVGATILLSSNRMIRLATRDGLTGAYNKTHFLSSLRFLIRDAHRKDSPIVVFMADLDHFKNINDKYGHPFGDIVLKKCADTITEALRKTDSLCRFGGEEFAACLPDITEETAHKVIERIRSAVEDMSVHDEESGTDVHVTISIGTTMVIKGQTVADAISRADKALYDAKRVRNAVSFYIEEEI